MPTDSWTTGGARTWRSVLTGLGAAVGTYSAVLRHRRAALPFAGAVVARLPLSMAPLGMVLLVQQDRGSYALAGLVTGGYALGTAVGSPLWGRLIDRWGQPRVLLPTVLVSAGLLAGLAVGTVHGLAARLMVVLAVAAGASTPPFSAAMRSTWRLVLDDEPDRRAAYALDAVAVETIFIGGPLLLSLLLVLTPPVVPLLVTAGLLAGGGLAYTRSLPDEPGPPDERRQPAAPATPPTGSPARLAAVAGPGVPGLLAVSAAVAVGFGTIDTTLAATAREVLGDEGRLGLLFAAIAGGSALSGLAYGVLASHATEHRRLPWTVGGFALGLVPLPVLMAAGRPSLWALLPVLFLAGVCIAPTLIIEQNVLDRLVAAGRRNEAQAWLSTSVTTGAAAGTAVAGTLVDHAGVAWSFAAACAAVGSGCGIALAAQHRWAALVAPSTGPAGPAAG